MQRIVSVAMDAGFYRALWPDLGQGAEGLAEHYLTTGWRAGADPAPWFSVVAYLEANPDVREAGVEPFHHYLTQGRGEGRAAQRSPRGLAHRLAQVRGEPRPGWDFAPPRTLSAAELRARLRTAEDEAYERGVVAERFDAAYYLAANPDIAAAGVDPLSHFLVAGWREGRDPNRRFSVGDYLSLYPDVAAADINPFVHYVQAGEAEGRRPKSGLGFRHAILSQLTPMARRIAEARAQAKATPTLGPARLAAALAAAPHGLKGLHLTFSHDDPDAHIGGVQLCLRRERLGVARLGFDHLHVHPATPWPVLRRPGEAAGLGVSLNGAALGVFAAEDIAACLAAAVAATAPRARTLAIHSLLGHDPAEVLAIARAAGLAEGWFWLHDFASLCAGYHLMRDDVADCGAPPPDSAACSVCVYGPERARHLEGHRLLFEALSLTAASPSAATLALWRRATDLPVADAVVAPHAVLQPNGPAPAAEPDAPFRIAFAGLPQSHKGWPVFRDLALRLEGDRRYAFSHFAARTEGGLPIDFTPVIVTEDPSGLAANAMQAAIAAARVDAVLIWPLCRETFSFTAYEAVAAGAALITHPDSGNVAAFTAAGGHGRVLADEAALYEAFETGEILALARGDRRPLAYDLAFGALTADLVAQRSARRP